MMRSFAARCLKVVLNPYRGLHKIRAVGIISARQGRLGRKRLSVRAIHRPILVGWLVGALLLAGCASRPPTPRPVPTPTLSLAEEVAPPPTLAPTPTVGMDRSSAVALVNGQPIARARWEEEVRRVQAVLAVQGGEIPPPEEIAQAVLEELINEQLIRQAAEAEGLAISESQLDEVIAREIEVAGGEAAFEVWLAQNHLSREEYRAATGLQLLTSALREWLTSDLRATQPQIHLRHILLATEEEAATLQAELDNGADFATLAATHSTDPGTWAQGGDLGWLPRGLLPTPLDDTVWSLGPGERAPILQSEFGFHLVEVIEQAPARPLSLEMLQTLQQQAWERWLSAARAQAEIEQWQTP